MSEATLRSATGAHIGRTSLDNDSRPSPSPGASPRLPSAILHTTTQDEAIQPVSEDEQSTTVTRPPFSPFYTLINDSGNSTTHHPVNVHYIFSDDDTDILTTACLAAIPGPSSQSSSGITARSASSSMASPSKEQPSNTNSRPSSKSGPHQNIPKEPEHRTILIDLDDTGTQITSAQSLTSSWQVMSTNISPAPTWEEGPRRENDAATERFMLSIEGLNGIRQDLGRQQGKEVSGEDFRALKEEFEKRMAMLRTVVKAGDKRLRIDRESEDVGAEEEDVNHEPDQKDEGKE